MWIFTKGGNFLSVVQKPEDIAGDTLTVRARAKGDIESVFSGVKVVEGHGSDYLYRTTLSREVVVAQIAQAVQEVNYTNFKKTVKNTQRSGLLARVWSVMFELQGKWPNSWNPNRDLF
jgi:hypothetical protein